MTVSAQETIFQYVGNGVTTTFAYNCQVLQPNDLFVYANGVEITSGITKNGIGSLTGGTVVFSVAPATGVQIILEREVALERTTDYQQNGDFLARVVNPDFNRIWMAIQQAFTSLNRALRFPKSDVNPITELPNAAARADKLLSFDSLGNPVVVAPSAQSATALALQYAAPNGTSFIGFLQAGIGTVFRTLLNKLLESSASVKDFGAVGDDSADDTAALLAAFTWAAANAPCRIMVPKGIYRYSALGNLALSNVTIEGYGSGDSVLKCTGAGYAINMDGDPGGVFVQNCNLRKLTIQGNAATTAIIRARKLARCQWSDINLREAETTAGVGLLLQGTMLSRFDSIMCSQDRQAMVSAPSEGLRLEATLDGNSSLNVFNSVYMEGAGSVGTNTIDIGIRLSGADQNTFLGGSPESCKLYGLLVSATSRYNTFIGVGFENLNATADVGDGGITSRYINCYSSQNFILQGRSASVEGGFFERIQIDPGAIRNTVSDVVINNWATGAGGLFDSGTGSETKNVYDADLAAFIEDKRIRFFAYVGTSATNQTGNGAVATLGLTELFDDTNNFAANTFTAPVAGRYHLNASVCVDGISTAATLVSLKIVTTTRTYIQERSVNPKVGGTQEAVALSTLAAMAVGDTATVTITVSGMAGNTVTILGNATTMWSTFSGEKIG